MILQDRQYLLRFSSLSREIIVYAGNVRDSLNSVEESLYLLQMKYLSLNLDLEGHRHTRPRRIVVPAREQALETYADILPRFLSSFFVLFGTYTEALLQTSLGHLS